MFLSLDYNRLAWDLSPGWLFCSCFVTTLFWSLPKFLPPSLQPLGMLLIYCSCTSWLFYSQGRMKPLGTTPSILNSTLLNHSFRPSVWRITFSKVNWSTLQSRRAHRSSHWASNSRSSKETDSFVISAYQGTCVFKTLEDFVNMSLKDRPRAVIAVPKVVVVVFVVSSWSPRGCCCWYAGLPLSVSAVA